MVGISKKPVEGWLRFKLCRWTYCGYERNYFSAIDTATAIAYAEQRARYWDNAELVPVHPERKGVYYWPIWEKRERRCCA